MQRLRFPPDTWDDSDCSVETFVSFYFVTEQRSAQQSFTASSSHQKLVRFSCLNCKTMRRIPAPPLSQGDNESPPDPESAMQVDGTRIKGRKRKRSKKGMYKQPFFERPEHILFRGNKMVVKTEDPAPGGTTAQVSESVRIETVRD